LRTIFGDGAAATLSDAADYAFVSAFASAPTQRGDSLMVNSGGARPAEQALQPRTKMALASNSIWTVRTDPVDAPRFRKRSRCVRPKGTVRSDVQLFLVTRHAQAGLETLRQHLHLDEQRMPTVLRDYGNTSHPRSDISTSCEPRAIAARHAMFDDRFGVGFSWPAACGRKRAESSAGRAD